MNAHVYVTFCLYIKTMFLPWRAALLIFQMDCGMVVLFSWFLLLNFVKYVYASVKHVYASVDQTSIWLESMNER